MELSFQTDFLNCYDRVYSQMLRKDETQDFVVPDTLPDITEILCVSGNVFIRSKDVGTGYVRLEAVIPAKLSYKTEDSGEIFCVDLNIPVSVSFEDDAIPDGGICISDLKLASLEGKMLNPRKVSIWASVTFYVQCYAPAQISFISSPSLPAEGIQMRDRTVMLTTVCGVSEKTFVLTDEFSLPGAVKNVLSQNTRLQVEECKTVGTKLVVKGTAKSSLLYLSEELSTGVIEFSTVFSQIIEMNALPDDPYVSVKLLLSGAYYDTSGSELQNGSMELHVVAQATAYDTGEHKCLTDVYSNRYLLDIQEEETELCYIQKPLTLRETLREHITTAVPVAELLQGQYELGIPQVEAGTITLPLSVCIHYRLADGDAGWIRHSFTAEFHQELEDGNYLEVMDVSTQELYLTIASGSIEVRLPIDLQVLLERKEEVLCVRNIQYDENVVQDLSECPSLVILRAKDDDDLWQLAKANASTVEAITEANALDQLTVPWEKLIIIPKVQ